MPLDCNDVQEWLSAELDSRLAPREEGLLADHLRGCEPCRGRQHVLMAQRHLVRAQFRGETASRRLRAQAEAILLGRPAETERETSVPSWWPAVRRRWFYALPASLAVGFLILAMALLWVGIKSREAARSIPRTEAPAVDPAWSALLAAHREAVAPDAGNQIWTAEVSTLRAFFDRRLPFAVRVVRLPSATLLGGRVLSLNGVSAACLVYDHAGIAVSVFEMPESSGAAPSNARTPGSGLEVGPGFSGITYAASGLRFRIVGALTASELRTTVQPLF